MGAGRGDLEPAPRRQRGQLTAQLDHLLSRAGYVVADLGAELHDRLMHLRLDVFLQQHLPVGQQLLDAGTQSARDRVDDLEFLLDAKGEDVRHNQCLAARQRGCWSLLDFC